MSDTLPSDPDELRAMIAALTAQNARMAVEVERMTATLRAQDLLVQALQERIAKLQRQRFGPSSEKIQREIAQLELALRISKSRWSRAIQSRPWWRTGKTTSPA